MLTTPERRYRRARRGTAIIEEEDEGTTPVMSGRTPVSACGCMPWLDIEIDYRVICDIEVYGRPGRGSAEEMFRIGLGIAACVVLLSGCGSRGQGIIMATQPPTPSRLAPEISLPLDIKQYADDPCSMLKPGQPVTKDLATGVNEGGNTCTWRAKTPQQPQMTATIDLASGGLEALYRKRGMLPYFEPTEIQSYPAVRYDSERAVPDQGRCAVSVGVAEDALLTVTTTIADPSTLNYPVPCPDADLLANAIISDVTSN